MLAAKLRVLMSRVRQHEKVQQRIRGGSNLLVRTIHYCLDDVSVYRHSSGGAEYRMSRPELQQAMRFLDRLS